ncbi:MAG: chemotaxis protein CheW [Thiolinea sp.]
MAQTAFCYKTGDYHIVLEEGIRSELLTFDSIYPVPFSPDWCIGLASARGDLFPVLDMHRVLLNQSRPGQQSLLWLKHPAFSPIVVSCDGLPRQIELPAEDEESERMPGLPGWIRQTWVQDNELLLGADHARLFRTLSKQIH